MAKKATTFEAAVTRLDEIVKQLEEGGESLDSSMKLFEVGPPWQHSVMRN